MLELFRGSGDNGAGLICYTALLLGVLGGTSERLLCQNVNQLL